ncbi:MAG TPA: LysM peptidoglycan-binding domain-containing protein [Candidatus Ligilactobacillus excrementipullorum]|nr:LysM peptidoglycan-binding domain-containing protein [Candidatus Ligilactobacillus excrementipullorum]
MNKKLVTGLAIAAGLFLYSGTIDQVQAASRETGTDLAKYQGYSAQKGREEDKFAISQIGGYTNGYFYNQDTYKSQISSGIAQGLRMHTYIWFEPYGNSALAANEVNHFINQIQTPKGSIVALDFEEGAGVNKQDNTDAAMKGMQIIKDKGFTPVLYTGKYFANQHMYPNQIINKFGKNRLWIASYATMNASYGPNFNYFPSMDGVGMWQWTSNYAGKPLDGDVDLTGITKAGYKGYTNPSVGGKLPVPNKPTQATNEGHQANKTPKKDIKAGYTVKVNYSAKKWANGVTMPSWVRGKSYKVIQVSGNKVLLGGIMSWINKKDVEIALTKQQTSKAQTVAQYVVKPGDSWWSIATVHGMSMYNLAMLNGKSTNSTIYPGQRLVIKKGVKQVQQVAGRYRIVKSGDTLQYLSYLTGYSVSYLASKNGIVNKNNIYVGQRIYY